MSSLKDSIIDSIIFIKEYFQENETFIYLLFYSLLIFMIIIGFIIFMFNPYNILNYYKSTVLFLYIIITGFILYFILLKSTNTYVKTYNFKLDIFLYSLNFGKIILFIIAIYLSFLILYNLTLHLISSSLKFSFLFTIVLVILVLSIINSYTDIYDNDISQYQFINLIKDIIFYIPCLITDFIDFIIVDYKQTPSTVIILLITLIIVCLIYVTNMYIKSSSNNIILIKKPEYLNKNVLILSNAELTEKIIKTKPFYERALIRMQEKKSFETSLNPKLDVVTPVPDYTDKYTRKEGFIEGFNNIISEETVPIHLTLDDYDKYILKQALWKNPNALKDLNNSSTNDIHQYINDIISKQNTLMGYYEWIMLKLQLLNAGSISKNILGDMLTSSYHYSLSYWIFLNNNTTLPEKQTRPELIGKDLIVKYGNRPSMYYEHDTKELTVEYIDINNNSIILYKSPDILYQRWNHVVMNYDYGIFDLFINGNLVYSNPKVINFDTNDEILEVGNINNSNIGGISHMNYYEEPIDLEKIKLIYKNHPSF
jgi:hypothetical protein